MPEPRRKRPPSETWRNRIVGSGDEPPGQLLANPRNWRTHPASQRDALRGSLSEIGWVQQILVNRQTGHVVDGHARVEEALSQNEPTVPVLYVDLTPEEEGLVLATLDPIGAMATRDDARLTELLNTLSATDPGLAALLGDLAPVTDDRTYTDAVDIPQYQIIGECPVVSDLYDESKTIELTRSLDGVEIDEATRAFLIAAAQRHIVFNYRAIAEFYPHASASVQRLMEDSALVIIDVDDAMRNGYARLIRRLEDDDGE